MSTATVTCANCRHEMAASALFCPHCGRAKVRDDGDALLGTVLGDRFLIVERLGQGASGNIYRAEHVTLRRKVAIKVLHLELTRDDLAIERFRREATTVADIKNDHIVDIHDFGKTDDGRLYLAMELLDGETLDAVLAREGRLSVERVVDVMTQVGEALIEAHAFGYVHRDVRPRNILLQNRRGRAGFVKLLDFGLAKLVEREGSAASTSLGMTFGDPRYMSPEQARGDAIDRRADIYQLGCMAYEMLTGAPPFVGGRVFDVLSRHVTETPAPLSRTRADVPAWLDAAVMRMLAKRPDDRFATMSRMVEALKSGAATGAVMPDTTARTEEAEPPASVSQAMKNLGRTSLGPHGGDEPPVVVAAEALRPGSETGPRGTPRVGIPAQAAPAVEAIAEESTLPSPAPDSGRVLGPSGSTGKLPQVGGDAGKLRPRRPSDSAGISSVWYADGDKLDGGDELEESQARKLERARRLVAHESMSDGYAPASRPMWKLVAIGAGAVIVVVVLVVALVSSGSDGGAEQAQASKRVEDPPPPPPPVVDPALVPDAGVAAVAPPVDAGAPVKPGAGTTAGTGKKTGTGTVRRPDEPPDLPPAEVKSGAVTDEQRSQAEFFAKAGEQQLRNGDAQAAAGSFKKALDLDPRNVSASVGMAEVAMQQGLYDNAIRHLKKAAKLAKGNAKIQTLLGECYLNNGQTKLAEAAFKAALKLDPDNARARAGYEEAASRLPPPADDP